MSQMPADTFGNDKRKIDQARRPYTSPLHIDIRQLCRSNFSCLNVHQSNSGSP